ncbi:MAG TPA: glycosyltransferase family 2 protein [Casimicrobiaceae bacterium]|nr:glycosyltransferase family 2 protein [Casimicrobiaceae bacterium]
MRLFGVAMVRNEADVIEAFVRHNLTVLDGLALIDHDSLDGTSDILGRLQAENLRLRVERDERPEYLQSERTTRLARETLERERADFVFALDADEFLKCASRPTLDRALAEVPPGTHAVAHWQTYVPVTFDDALPFGRDHLRRRLRAERRTLYKVVVGRSFVERVADVVAMGNHLVSDPARAEPPPHARLRPDVVAVAHCPVRSRRQLESKIIIGHLAHLASGPVRRDLAFHWRRLYEELRDGGGLTPERLREIACNYGLQPSLWQPVDQVELIDDPVALEGGSRYPPPPATGVLPLLMRFAETLARRHSRVPPPAGRVS